MPASYRDFVSTSRALVDSRMGSSCTGTMNEVECLIVGMGERGTILVQSHEISYLSEPS